MIFLGYDHYAHSLLSHAKRSFRSSRSIFMTLSEAV